VGPSQQREFFREIGFLLGTPAAVLLAVISWWQPWQEKLYRPGANNSVFDVAAGTWDSSNADQFCRRNPHTISFSVDRSQMYLDFPLPVVGSPVGARTRYTYAVHGFTATSIRGFLEGETRRTADGELVVWDLVLTSDDTYEWRPTGSMYWQGSQVKRCPAGASPSRNSP
jgi:hypothetical protein